MMLSKDYEMQGKVAVITGAASGLGRETAIKLATLGAHLWLVDYETAGLEETAHIIAALDLPPSHRATCHIQTVDLSCAEACHTVIPAAIAAYGRLDALCNVAGLIYMADTATMPQAQWDKIIAVNLSAPFFLSQAAIPHLLKQDGAIVNVASCAAFQGQAYTVAYGASKAALVNMTKSMAMEYQKHPIRINAVAPGGMRTNIAVNLQAPANCDVELLKRFSGMRGMVSVSDVADMVVLLASSAGRGYHGSCISIDAGITAG